MNERSLEVEHIKTKFTKFLKVIEILVQRGEWILTRLFEDPKGLLQEKAFGVWLCKDFQWECYILDDYVQVDETNHPLFTHHAGKYFFIQAIKNGQMFCKKLWHALWEDTRN